MFISKKTAYSKYFFFLRKYLMKKRLAIKSNDKESNLLLNGALSSPRIFRKLNQEHNLVKNWNLLEVLQSYNGVKTIKTSATPELVKTPLLFKYTSIYLSLTKELILLEWEKKRQFFFFFTELLVSLEKSNLTFLKEMSIFSDKKNLYTKENAEITLFHNYLVFIFNSKDVKISLGSKNVYSNFLLLKNMQNLLISNSFNILTANLIKKDNSSFKMLDIKSNVLDMYSFSQLTNDRWEALGLPPVVLNNISLENVSKQQLNLKKSKIISVIRRRTKVIPNISLRNYNVFINKTNFALKTFVWKHNNTFSSNSSLDNVAKLSRLYNKNLKSTNRNSSFQVLYLISRIEDKILYYTKSQANPVLLAKMLRLRNLLFYLLEEKKVRLREQGAVLATKNSITRIRTKTWKLKLFSFLKESLEKTKIDKNNKFYAFINLLFHRLSLGRKSSNLKTIVQPKKEIRNIAQKFIFANSFFIPQQKGFRSYKKSEGSKIKQWRNKFVNVQRTWVGSKVVLAEKHLNFSQKKAILSSWINRPVDLFFINALSLTKFAFKNERALSPNNNPNLFLSVLDRDFINKYKYIGIYIKDLVRVAFISVFFKKPSFLAKFMAFQLAKLPRNRKETNFVRFLIKVIKTFAAERKEILGVRIRFKGRVNRWRRTKFILGNRGTLPLQTISERIEQGTAQAVNKKGAVGIRIWLRYKQSFSFVLKDHIIKYLNYSKVLKTRQVRRTLSLK